jgi:cytosine/adenosine deaminase-related metal-dependent hydrolase
LKVITSTKAGWSFSDYAESWLSGAQMLLCTGTTTVGDIEAVPQLLPEVWTSTPLRVISFLEMIGITSRRPPQAVLQIALEKIASLTHDRCFAALSPHAPYSTVPELLTLTARAARRGRSLVCSHVAESALEYAMFRQGHGEMFEWLRRSGRDMSDCGLGSPVQHLERCGALNRRLLAAHVNYLGKGDAAQLSHRGVSVVHCPRSHSYFRHAPFPLRRLLREKVNVCLGTDSLASVYKTRGQSVELNMFDEMRTLADQDPSLSSRAILQMATLNGARALGFGGRAGQLRSGAWADLIALPATAKASGVHEAILQHRGNVVASMIDGSWAIPPA